MSFIPKPHEIYRHFKGNLYQVTAIAEHTETGEQLIVYQALYGDFRTYARPLAMFTEVLNRDQYPDAGQMFRFELQGPDAARQREAYQNGGPEAVLKDVEDKTAERKEDPMRGGRSCSLSAGEGVFSADRWGAGMEHVSAEAGEFSGESEQDEITLDPLILEFLDANSYEQRLNILAGLHHRITDDMITTMAIACDVEIHDGDLEERYEALRTCLLTLERYECNRLR